MHISHALLHKSRKRRRSVWPFDLRPRRHRLVRRRRNGNDLHERISRSLIPMKLLTIIVGLMSFIGIWPVPLKGDSSPDRDRLVAQSDRGKVFYRMISCEQQASVAADCHAREQQRLARYIHRQWINAAVETYAVTL